MSRERVFWSRVLRPGAAGPCAHLSDDADFREFLGARLREDRAAAEQRLLTLPRVEEPGERGLRLIDELLESLDRGQLPDETSLQILLTLYSAHPAFAADWLPVSLPSQSRSADRTHPNRTSSRRDRATSFPSVPRSRHVTDRSHP